MSGSEVCPPAFPSGLVQPAGSMRFALDSLLLASFVAASLTARPLWPKNLRRKEFVASFAEEKTPQKVLAAADLGCGCGAASLALLQLVDHVRIWGLDREEVLVAAALENAGRLHLACRTRFETLDVAELAQSVHPCCDVVFSNPPFWEEAQGRQSVDPLNNRARRGDARPFWRAARSLLVHHGRFFVVYPASRLAELAEGLSRHSLGLRALQFVRATADECALRVLAEARKDAAADVDVLPDMVLYEQERDGRRCCTVRARAFCPWLDVSRETSK